MTISALLRYVVSAVSIAVMATLVPLPTYAHEAVAANAVSASLQASTDLTVSSTYYADDVRANLAQTSAPTRVVVTSATGFAAGDELLVIAMAGTDVGTFDTATILSISGTTLTLSTPLAHTYNPAATKVAVQKIPHFAKVTVAATGVLTAHPWDGNTGGIIFIRAQSIEVQQHGKIIADGLGYRGGKPGTAFAPAAQPGEGPGGGAAGAIDVLGTGGSGGSYGTQGFIGHKGETLLGATPTSTYGEATLQRLYLGSGGGAGGSTSARNDIFGLAGGAGGGIVVLDAPTITLADKNYTDLDTSITAHGLKGGVKANCNGVAKALGGGGGAGSGGTIWLISQTFRGGNNYAQVGAVGGDGNTKDKQQFSNDGYQCSMGGKGGSGRVRLEYATYSGGFTNPLPGFRQINNPDLVSRVTGTKKTIPGGLITYNFEVANEGGRAASDVQLNVSKPPYTAFVSVSQEVPVTITADSLLWSIGSLPSQGMVHFSATFKVNEDFPLDVTYPPRPKIYLTLTQSTTDAYTNNDYDGSNGSFSLDVVKPYTFTFWGNAQSVTKVGSSYSLAELRNTGMLPDTYQINVSGTGAAWSTLQRTNPFDVLPDQDLVQNQVEVLPGETAYIQTKVTPPAGTCGEQNVKTQLTARSLATGTTIALTETLHSIKTNFDLALLAPLNASESASRSVQFSWTTSPTATSTLHVYPRGKPEQAQTYTTTLGLQHTVQVKKLTRNTEYEWFVTAVKDCETRQSSVRRFTVGNGISFVDPAPFFSIDHDYNLSLSLQVVNNDVVSHTVAISIEHSYKDLIANFVGDGSIDKPITLLPKEKRVISLAAHAQDAQQSDYLLTARLTADANTPAPIQDTATIALQVLRGGFEMHELSVDPNTGARTYEVVNGDKPLTDLKVEPKDKATGKRARVYMIPDISHARLEANQVITFTLVPMFGPAQVAAGAKIQGVQAAKGFPAAADGGIDIDLEASANGLLNYLEAKLACPAPNEVYSVTRTHVYLRARSSDWYCTNKPDISVPFTIPDFVTPDLIEGDVLVSADFAPKGDEPVSPHSTYLRFNDPAGDTTPFAALENMVPQGSYSWPIDALSRWRYSLVVETKQEINLHSQHPNQGHYMVASDFQLGIPLKSVTLYVCAPSQQDAEDTVDDTYDMSDQPHTLSLEIKSPGDGTIARPDAAGNVDIHAIVSDDQAEYQNMYRVEAKITYLDVPSEPEQTIMLSDAGDNDLSGDPAKDDRHFHGRWAPTVGGRARIVVKASGPAALAAEQSVTVEVRALPDFTVKRVFQNLLSIIALRADVRAEVTNLGIGTSSPVHVVFEYYNVDERTGEPTTYITKNTVTLPNGLRHGEVVEVVDTAFEPPTGNPYYAKVIIDP